MRSSSIREDNIINKLNLLYFLDLNKYTIGLLLALILAKLLILVLVLILVLLLVLVPPLGNTILLNKLLN